MFKFVITLGLGIYAGIYLAQNYDVPRVDEPEEIVKKIKDFADSHRKS